jgi:ABC-type nitrate/sulfonate/bicarbonate transport system substrate-binding protein
LVLSLQANIITVSQELWRLGVRDAHSLRQQMWQDRKKKIYTFAVSCPLSAAYFFFSNWLRSPDAPPCVEMRIECIPPEQMFPLLKLGYLDGYCAGEPWGSVAVQAGVGACLQTSATLADRHPEKVLLVRKEFDATQPEIHEHLIAALLEAAFLCDQPENRDLLCQLLTQPQYVNAPIECLSPALIGPFEMQGHQTQSFGNLYRFYGTDVNEPSPAKAVWLADQLVGSLSSPRRPPSAINHLFRPDVFRRAQRLLPGEIINPRTCTSEESALVGP